MLVSWVRRRQESLSALGPGGTQSCDRPRRQNRRIAIIQVPQATKRVIEDAIEHAIERALERLIERLIKRVIERVIERERVIKRAGRYSRHYRSFIGPAATVLATGDDWNSSAKTYAPHFYRSGSRSRFHLRCSTRTCTRGVERN